MLENDIMSQEDIKEYMEDIKSWLEKDKDTPVEEMASFFTKRVDGYDNNHLEHWQDEYEHISDYFKEGLKSLLDVGCGTGLELEAIYKRFPDVNITGIDLSESMLKKLQVKYNNKHIETIIADYFKYPFEQKKYDAAMSFETLHHFEFKKKQKIYDKLYQAISDGGYYIECDYIACCDEHEKVCLENYKYKRKKFNIPDSQFVHIDIPLTLEHQIQLMKNAGFSSVNVLLQDYDTFIIRAEK